jgi:hypothetical protein
VFCMLLGEAVLLGSPPLFVWFLIVFAANAVYIPLIEERSLESRFGDEYVTYRRNVPRWIPRLIPSPFEEPWFSCRPGPPVIANVRADELGLLAQSYATLSKRLLQFLYLLEVAVCYSLVAQRPQPF